MLAKAILLGRIGKKQKIIMNNGEEMLLISLATTKKYTTAKGEKKTLTNWHNVNFFNKFIEVADSHTEIGDIVYIEGDISSKKVIGGEKAGQWVYSINANEIKFLPKQNPDDSSQNEPPEDL